MNIVEAFILPADVEVTPVSSLPKKTRDAFDHCPDDWVVTRRHSRTPSRIVDGDLASLLLLFRRGRTIVDAVLAFSAEHAKEPERILESAVPALQRFMSAAWLVPAGSVEADSIGQSLPIGGQLAKFTIIDCLRVLEDTELYQARGPDGALVALKLLRPSSNSRARVAFQREIEMVRGLNGYPGPEIRADGTDGKFPFLAMEWCQGVPITVLAAEIRRSAESDRLGLLRNLSCCILAAYHALHTRGVVHGDVHPGNIIASSVDQIRIVDFGMATGLESHGRFPRGGVASYFDPQHAQAQLGKRRPPRADPLSEQYSLAALIYQLFTGAYYLDFSKERDAMMRQIVEEPALPFAAHGGRAAPEIESIVGKALSKNPEHRFASVLVFAQALQSASTDDVGVALCDVPANDKFQEYIDRYFARLRPEGNLFDLSPRYGPLASATFGAAGIAYGIYRAATLQGDPELLSLADLWATRALYVASDQNAFRASQLEITESSVGNVSFYHTLSGVHLVRAIVSQSLGDFVTATQAIDEFLVAADKPCTSVDLTLGRSSTVVACALLLDAMQGLPGVLRFGEQRRRVRALGQRTLSEVWPNLQDAPQLASLQDESYLGIAHGWAGMCFAALLWGETTGDPLPAGVGPRLDKIAELAEPSGRGVRWPIKVSSRGRAHNYMCSWCNGAPGHLHLWVAAHRRFGDSRFAALAEGAAWSSWECRDRIGSICCGYAGRAYALLSWYRHTGEDAWLARARELTELAQLCTSEPAMPYSLYKGELGIAVLTADLLAPARARLPLFETEYEGARDVLSDSSEAASRD